MPIFCGIGAALGSGFVWASMALGSGELIWWPYLTAKYGAAFIGLLLPSCAIQFFVNQEIARYTVTTGEGLFQGFARIHVIFGIFMWIMMVISFAWFGSYATSGATALFELTHFPVGWSQKMGTLFWAYLLIGFMSILLLSARRTYIIIERFMKTMIVICLIGAAITLTNKEVLRTAFSFFPAYFNPFHFFKHGFPSTWDSHDINLLITAICFAGMGGFHKEQWGRSSEIRFLHF
ncbi:MAG: Nramp family divalent metal transporter [Elusimicrobia bacterium]|nr:Nramp family divalent metal transporter [Elusimicrobiota bacterium]